MEPILRYILGEDKTNLANAILKDDNTAMIKSEDIIKSITYSEQGLFSNKDLEYMGSSLYVNQIPH